MPPRRPLRRALAFKRRLLAWFRAEGRDLPWRRTRDPYRVTVSEFMLQQTQVSRVREFYPRFLDRYPTVHDLARASAPAVREAWEGLGYYRRAANLHALARRVVEEHAGVFPDDVDALRALPGVGEYTAGAVTTFAYERPMAAVDTNVDRVLRRVFHPRIGHDAPAIRRIRDLATDLQPHRGRVAWEFNQALMDLGALVCTARAPRCPACPVKTTCATGRRR